MIILFRQPLVSRKQRARYAKYDDHKLNIVIYGINECENGTNRANRQSQDLHNVTKIATDSDNRINPLSIRDVLWIGKYQDQANKPCLLLVKLNRTMDISTLLPNAAKSLPKGIKIKPDMICEERHIKSLLLKKGGP